MSSKSYNKYDETQNIDGTNDIIIYIIKIDTVTGVFEKKSELPNNQIDILKRVDHYIFIFNIILLNILTKQFKFKIISFKLQFLSISLQIKEVQQYQPETHIDFEKLINEQQNNETKKQQSYIQQNKELKKDLNLDDKNILDTKVNASTPLEFIVKDMTISTELANQSSFTIFYGLIFQGLITPKKYITILKNILPKQKSQQQQKEKYLYQMVVDQLEIFIKVFLPFCSNLASDLKQFTFDYLKQEDQCKIYILIDQYTDALQNIHASYDVVIYDNNFYSIILSDGRLNTIQHSYNISRLIEFKQISPQLMADYFQYQYYQIQQQITINNFYSLKPDQITKQYKNIFNNFIQYFNSSHCNQINKLKYILELLLQTFKQNNIVATLQIIEFVQNTMMEKLLSTFDLWEEQTTYQLPDNLPVNSLLKTLTFPSVRNHPQLEYVTNYNFVIKRLGLDVEENEIYQEKIYGALTGRNILKICSKLQPYVIYPYEIIRNYYDRLLKQVKASKIELQTFLENSAIFVNLVQNMCTYKIDFNNILLYKNIEAFIQ